MDAGRGLGRWFDRYNQERPHQALGYATPSEVYFPPDASGAQPATWEAMPPPDRSPATPETFCERGDAALAADRKGLNSDRLRR